MNPASRRIGLVGCVKLKRDTPAAAKDLYVSTLFRGRRRYVERTCDAWLILSAEHGVVDPEQWLAPYERTLKSASTAERREWAARVLAELERRLGDLRGLAFELHAGAEYRDHGLAAGLLERGATVTVPARGLSQGQQLAFYNEANAGASPEEPPPKPAAPAAARPQARRVTPSADAPTGGRYEPLAQFLSGQRGDRVTLSFSRLESILGRALPASAHRHRPWWGNTASGHGQARAWMDVGWRVAGVDLRGRAVTFSRDGGQAPSEPARMAARSAPATTPITPPATPRTVPSSNGRLADLVRFYDLLDRLAERCGGPRLLAGCHGRMGWPARGVYFFFEPGEHRSDSGEGPRVVRVGTHALAARSSTTLWNRLSQHQGTISTGGGNHRGSIFRLLVGTALKSRAAEQQPASWGVGADPGAAARRLGTTRTAVVESEAALERRVSEDIGTMPFLWLAIDDPPGPHSLRGYVERNAIALLSNYRRPALDPPSPAWLGRHCDRERVRESGLWNNNHVDEEYDPAFLDLLARMLQGPDDS